MSLADITRRLKLQAENIATLKLTDKSKAKLSKHQAADLKALVVEVEELLREMGLDIELGDSDKFKHDSDKVLKDEKTELEAEDHIHAGDDYLELKEIERLNDVMEHFHKLVNFLKEKKIKNNYVNNSMDSINQLHDRIKTFVGSQEKLSWNVAHDHAAVLRFIHVRDPKATANRIKVLERQVRKEINKEKNEEHKLIILLEKALKPKDLKEFESIAKEIFSETKKYSGLANSEFKKFYEANKRDNELLQHTLECLGRIGTTIKLADEKGYDHEESQKWLEEIRGIVIEYHKLTSKFNKEDKGVQNALAA